MDRFSNHKFQICGVEQRDEPVDISQNWTRVYNWLVSHIHQAI